MKLPKLFKDNNDEKNNSTIQKLVSDENEEKKVTHNEVNTIHPKPVGKVEKEAPISTSEDGINFKPILPKKTIFKRIVDKKLTIILIESTFEVFKVKEIVLKIVRSLVSPGLVSIINYGSTVKQSEIFDVSIFNGNVLLCDTYIGDSACLYDALIDLESLISKEYMHIEENENEKVRINQIEVIGIGTCTDNCSKVTKEAGIDCFCKVINKHNITTKYFCLTEETFMNAAEIGFRSIGAILRDYQ